MYRFIDMAVPGKVSKPSVSQRAAPKLLSEEAVGKRDGNKQKKLAKIAKAAKQVFTKKGFEDATMQEIAKLAGVATGTLFLYADNKRDIAFLASAEDFASAIRSFSETPVDGAFVDQMIACYRPYFIMHNANPEMAKIILSEFLFFVGKQARRHGEGAIAMKTEAIRRAVHAQRIGELIGTVPAPEIGDLVYYIFQGVIRRWVQTGAVDVEEGLGMFHRSLSLGLAGMMAKPAQ
ncbi:TetR/AcrR family transcriptional regulator [Neorhizobium lilium]|uniref:TetR/AcrR family transcriptional regulator n=1 Tax=Neorhizobium lilium TaxID=2503024 RepID=UPI0013E3FE56|nr:TetR/AcrR family transcriptional regulator [Neorhizobium lilium]